LIWTQSVLNYYGLNSTAFCQYGELRIAPKHQRKIMAARDEKPITTVADLKGYLLLRSFLNV
jgi:16S rRNA C1402 N4-methylase RsmH